MNRANYVRGRCEWAFLILWIQFRDHYQICFKDAWWERTVKKQVNGGHFCCFCNELLEMKVHVKNGTTTEDEGYYKCGVG